MFGGSRGSVWLRTATKQRLTRYGLGAVLAFGALGLIAAGNSGQATPPPVLLITIDTLRWDSLGSYGGLAATPALDALAGRGVRFDHAQAHAVLTLPSHTSILTGLDPSRHGVHDNTGFRAGAELNTWAERLGEAGYDTGAFIAAFPLDSQFGLEQGFDHYDDYYNSNEGTQFRLVERAAPEVVAAARSWLGERRGPWFAWVHVYDPHAPYDPPAEYRDSASPYLGEVSAVDAALAPLLADAARRNAVVIVTSDHGESLGEHGESTHGIFAYESTLRVPLLFDGVPGQRSGTRVAQRVRHLDLLPTVLDLLELPADGTEGRSLLPLLRGLPVETNAWPHYFESMTPNLTRNWAPLRGIVRGSSKFIDLPLPELYDLASDPDELENVVDSRGTELRSMKEHLDQHLAAAEPSAAPMVEDPETLRRLRALGYLGGAPEPSDDREYGPEDDPKNLIRLDALLQVATAAADAGDTESARRLFGQAVAERPDLIQAQKLLSVVEFESGDRAAAITRLESVVSGGSEAPLILLSLAYYYREVGRLDDALATIELALDRVPDDVEGLTLLATVHGTRGDTTQALLALDRALALDPSNASAYANRGVAYLSSGDSASAAQAFREAVRFDPNQAGAHNGLGVIAAQGGDLETAVEHWQSAVDADPGQLDAMENLGGTLNRLGRYREAIQVLERLIRAAPDNAEVRGLLDQLKRDHGG